MNPSKTSRRWMWLVYLLWALFVNGFNMWVIGPLVKDLALLGVIAVLLIILVWLTSIPAYARKKWITFTVFALLLGQGLSSVAFYPTDSRIIYSVIMLLGLFFLALFITKAGWRNILVSTLGILVATIWLPVSEWPFLTHFTIAKEGRMSLIPADIPALPWAVINGKNGQSLVTLSLAVPTKAQLKELASESTHSKNSLYNLLQSADHEYELVQIRHVGGHTEVRPLPPRDMGKIQPWDLISSTFPFAISHWKVVDNHVITYLSPTLDAESATSLGLEPVSYPGNFLALSQQAWDTDMSEWQEAVTTAGSSMVLPALEIHHNVLEGEWHGVPIHVPVKGQIVLSEGSFTSRGAHQVLVEGADILQVVDLNSQQVVGTYHATLTRGLPHNIVTGPLRQGGRDAIFVNATPAYILTVQKDGQFHLVYTAPNDSLRFEAVLQSKPSDPPEIITNDPSALRDVPTRYFTSYTYRQGQLYRNWRVYETNVVNVQPIQWVGGREDLAVSIYGSGEYLILRRSYLPVLPATAVAFVLICLVGFGLRIRERRSSRVQSS